MPISTTDAVAIDAMVSFQLGPGASFFNYDRSVRNPMNYVVDEASHQANVEFRIYWVREGLAETFSLAGLPVLPVAVNGRYLELYYFVRKLFTLGPAHRFQASLATRAAFTVMADSALRRGNGDVAVSLLMKSLEDNRVFIPHADTIVSLEMENISETYMALWFFAMLHELGHAEAAVSSNPHYSVPFSAQWLSDAITQSLVGLPYPDSFRREVIERAKAEPSTFVLGDRRLRSEGFADVFATLVLLKATINIIRDVHDRDIDVEQMSVEVLLYIKVIAFIESCRRVALLIANPTVWKEREVEWRLFPVALAVRSFMINHYFTHAVAALLAESNDVTPDELDKAVQFLTDIASDLDPSVAIVDKAMNQAFQVALATPNNTEFEESFFREIRSDLIGSIEARRFCERADALGVSSEKLVLLKRSVAA